MRNAPGTRPGSHGSQMSASTTSGGSAAAGTAAGANVAIPATILATSHGQSGSPPTRVSRARSTSAMTPNDSQSVAPTNTPAVRRPIRAPTPPRGRVTTASGPGR